MQCESFQIKEEWMATCLGMERGMDEEKIRTCLVPVFENYFMFLKTRRTRKIGRTRLILSFFFEF